MPEGSFSLHTFQGIVKSVIWYMQNKMNFWFVRLLSLWSVCRAAGSFKVQKCLGMQ